MALGPVQIRSTFGAQAAARLGAQRLHRQRELELLTHQIGQIQHAFGIEGGRQIVLGYFPFRFGGGVVGLRHIPKLERRIYRQREILEAPAALELKRRLHPPGDPVRGAALLLDIDREMDWLNDAIIDVLRLEVRRLKRPFDVFARPVKLVEVEKHGSSPPATPAGTRNYTSISSCQTSAHSCQRRGASSHSPVKRLPVGTEPRAPSPESVELCPGFGDEQLLVEADAVAVRHSGEEVTGGGVEALFFNRAAIQELARGLADLLPESAQDATCLAELRGCDLVLVHRLEQKAPEPDGRFEDGLAHADL